MTARERSRRIMNYKPVDQLPILTFEPYEDEVVSHRRREGMPEHNSPTLPLLRDTDGQIRLALSPQILGKGWNDITINSDIYLKSEAPCGELHSQNREKRNRRKADYAKIKKYQ